LLQYYLIMNILECIFPIDHLKYTKENLLYLLAITKTHRTLLNKLSRYHIDFLENLWCEYEIRINNLDYFYEKFTIESSLKYTIQKRYSSFKDIKERIVIRDEL